MSRHRQLRNDIGGVHQLHSPGAKCADMTALASLTGMEEHDAATVQNPPSFWIYLNGQWNGYPLSSSGGYNVIVDGAESMDISQGVTVLNLTADSTHNMTEELVGGGDLFEIYQEAPYTATIVATNGFTFNDGRTEVVLRPGEFVSLAYYEGTEIVIKSKSPGRVSP